MMTRPALHPRLPTESPDRQKDRLQARVPWALPRRLALATLGGALLTALGACSLGKPGPEVHYYALSLPVPSVPAPEGRPVLMLQRFAARDPFAQETLVYRSSTYRVNFYSYHRWIAPPAHLVSEWTLRYLRGAGLFSKVSEYSGDLALSAIVRDFTETDEKDSWSASLSIDFMVTRTKDAAPVLMQNYSATQRAPRRNPEAIAEAMSRNLEQILKQLAADLEPVALAAGSPPAIALPTKPSPPPTR